MVESRLSQVLRTHNNFDFIVSAQRREATIVHHEREMTAVLSGTTMVVRSEQANSGTLIASAEGRYPNLPGRTVTDPMIFEIGGDGEIEVIEPTTELAIPSLEEILIIGLRIFKVFDEQSVEVKFGPSRMSDGIMRILGGKSFPDSQFSGSVGPDRRITLPYQKVLAGLMNKSQITSISA